MSRVKGIKTQFSELQAQWYEKLRADGFRDLENINDPDGLLNSSDPFRNHTKYIKRVEYQGKIDSFANDPQFKEITLLMVKHGNSKFTDVQISYIWDLHREGYSERRIARVMHCSQSCIHFMFKRLREWMNLVA